MNPYLSSKPKPSVLTFLIFLKRIAAMVRVCHLLRLMPYPDLEIVAEIWI